MKLSSLLLLTQAEVTLSQATPKITWSSVGDNCLVDPRNGWSKLASNNDANGVDRPATLRHIGTAVLRSHIPH